MRTILLVATLSLLALGASNAHAALPLNSLANAGFESGLDGWSIKGTGSLAGAGLVRPGAQGSDAALLVREVGAGSAWLHQDMAPVAGAPVTVLEFSARIVANLANPMSQGIRVLAAHNPTTGQGQFTALVDFGGGTGKLMVFCDGTASACPRTLFAPPADGEWHHYRLLLAGATGVGVLLVDDEPVATSIGNPASVAPPTRVLLGDLANHVSGRAPDVAWDEVYYGPSP